MNDSGLWQQFLNDDKKAFAEIFLLYHDDLFRYGSKISGNSDIVEDCIQDMFLKLWNNRNRLKLIRIIKPYLLRSLRNHIIDMLELSYNHRMIPDSPQELNNIVYSHEDFIISEEIDNEIKQKVIQALNKLKPNQKEIIYLRYFQDIDFINISEIMDMSVPSTRNLLSKSIKILRDLMIFEIFLLMLGKVN